MSDVLSFPGLGLELTINPILAEIGPFSIHWYGVIFALAFLAGTCFLLWKAKDFGVNADRAFDVLLAAFVGGIICARAYYVIFAWNEMNYAENPIRVFYIWEGGIAMYGGLIGAFAVGLWMCRVRKVKSLPMLDVAGISLLLAQAIGRWGNFINMEAFGVNTDLPWGMTSQTIHNYLAYHMESLAGMGITVDPSLPVHPTFFYESAWNLIGFLVLAFVLAPRRRFDGQMFLGYLAWYGAGRCVVEGLRTDSLMWGNIRVSQALALICAVVCTALIFVVLRKIKEKGDPDYLKLYALTEEGQAAVSGALYQKPGDGEETLLKDEARGEETGTGEDPEEPAEALAGQEASAPGEEEDNGGALEETAVGEDDDRNGEDA